MGESLLAGFRAAVRLPLLEATVTSSDGLVTSLVGISSELILSINELCGADPVLTAVLVAGVVLRPGLVIGVVLRADLVAGVFVSVGSLLAGLRAAVRPPFLEAAVMLSEGLVTSLAGLPSVLRSSINKHFGTGAFFTAVLVAGVLSATGVDFPAVLLVGVGVAVLDFVVAFDLLVRGFPSPRLTGSVLKYKKNVVKI